MPLFCTTCTDLRRVPRFEILSASNLGGTNCHSPTDEIVVGYLPSPLPGLPITTVQPTEIHPRLKPFPSFPSLSRNPPVPSQLTSPPPHSQTELAPVVTAVVAPRDAGRWPLLSHMLAAAGAEQELPLSTFYLPPMHAPTHPTQPATTVCASYTLQNTKHTTGKYKICHLTLLNSVALAEHPPLYLYIKLWQDMMALCIKHGSHCTCIGQFLQWLDVIQVDVLPRSVQVCTVVGVCTR